jgi:hypothetical protein
MMFSHGRLAIIGTELGHLGGREKSRPWFGPILLIDREYGAHVIY